MKRALVLSGGGARGSYQVGVWKALRELKIKYDIITGTSVGALNGALMVQDTYDLVENFWNNVDFEDIFSDDFFKKTNLNNREILKKYIKVALINKEKGLSILSLENNLNKYLDNDLFYKSNIDYGLVTYDVNTKKPIMLTKNEIPPNNLKDYIIASATLFPIFKKKKIGNNYYIDGGYYDNLPINLAIEMGATEIIAVNIGVFGIRKKIKNTNVKIFYIKPKSNLGFPAFFNKDIAQKNIRLGYNDTMKICSKYDGSYYTFNYNEIKKSYKKLKDKMDILIKEVIKDRPLYLIPYKLRFNTINITNFLNAIEFLGYLFNIDESKVYSIEEFNIIIVKKFEEFNELIKNKNLHVRTKLLKLRKHVAKSIFIKLNFLNHKKNRKKLGNLSFLFPKTLLSSVYLYLILDKNNF